MSDLYGLCAGYDEVEPPPAIFTRHVHQFKDLANCDRFLNGDRFYEYWVVSRNPELLKCIEDLGKRSYEHTFIRFEGAAKLPNGDYIVAYEGVSDFTRDVFAGDDATTKASHMANLLRITVTRVREARGRWAPFTNGKLNLALDKNKCPVLTRYAAPQGEFDERFIRGNLTFIKEFFVDVLGADEDTVEGYVDDEDETVARVHFAASLAPPPQRAELANHARRSAITCFWSGIFSTNDQTSALIQVLSEPANKRCLDAFLSTPINGNYPLMVVLRREFLAAGPSKASSTSLAPFINLGADVFASHNGESVLSMVVRQHGTTYNDIVRWCIELGAAEKLRNRPECHAAIVEAVIVHDDAASLLDYFVKVVGFDLISIRVRRETVLRRKTVLHRIATMRRADAVALARQVIELAPGLLAAEVDAPAFWPSPTVTPCDIASGEMKAFLIAERQRIAAEAVVAQQISDAVDQPGLASTSSAADSVASSPDTAVAASSGAASASASSSSAADPSAAALHDLLEQLRALLARSATRSGNTV
jgi:hypothetical protein